MNKYLQEEIITAINIYIDTSLSLYFESNSITTNNDLIALIATLKYWANPQGNYIPSDDMIVSAHFSYIPAILQAPRKILYNDKRISARDETEIILLLQRKLNLVADLLSVKNKLMHEITNLISNDNEIIKKWWENKLEDEKKKIAKKYNGLDKKEQTKLNKLVTQRYKASTLPSLPILGSPNFAYYNYYYFSNEAINFVNLDKDVLERLAEINFNPVIPLKNKSIQPINNESSDDEINDNVIRYIGPAALLALCLSGIIGTAYALKKTYNAIYNLFSHNKITRSLFRLVGISTGGWFGAVKGAVLGAMIGSFLPLIGTVAGTIIGSIFCGGLGAGAAAFITKYIAKGISTIFHAREINPSNPEKYQVTNKQYHYLSSNNYDLMVIEELFKAIKLEKSKIGLARYWPGTKEYKDKRKWNSFLKLIKNGSLIDFPLKIGDKYYAPLMSSMPESSPQPTLFSSAAIVNSIKKAPVNMPPSLFGNWKKNSPKDLQKCKSKSEDEDKEIREENSYPAKPLAPWMPNPAQTPGMDESIGDQKAMLSY